MRLGLTSFGGPVAHLGYFHNEFVERRKWLSERAYADLVALCPDANRVSLAVLAAIMVLAALYNPVWTSAIYSAADFGLALAAFTLLVFWKVAPWLVVLLTAFGGWVLSLGLVL